MSAEERGLGVEPGVAATLDHRPSGDVDGRSGARSVARFLRKAAIPVLLLGTTLGLIAWVAVLVALTVWLIHQVPF